MFTRSKKPRAVLSTIGAILALIIAGGSYSGSANAAGWPHRLSDDRNHGV